MFLASCSKPNMAPPLIEVTDPWIRKPIPPLDKTAGYFKVTNHSETPIVLKVAQSKSARKIEFHETLEEEGMMRMRRLKEVVVAPGETVSFEPGGKHLMVFGFIAGDSPVSVQLRIGEDQILEVPFDLR